MIGDVTYFGTGDGIEADISRVGGMTENRGREKEVFLLYLRPSFLFLIHPARTFPVRVPVVAISAFERLTPIGDLPFMILLAVFAGP